MGIPERRERERQELRQRILDAARELFAARGYESVTMREIARRIEYSATALYKHFADKEALVRELCRHDFDALAQRLLEAVSSGDPFERFARAGLVYLDFAARHPQHYRLMFMGGLPPTTPETGERDDPQHNAYVFVRALVTALLEAQLLRPELTDVDLVAQTTWAAVHGVAALELTLPNAEPWLEFRPRNQRFAAMLELVGRALAREPERASATFRRVLAEDTDKPWSLGSGALPARKDG
ncbi:MAG TPA: TetR/AcrR family transcriptional regulator [Polyangiaceae bacterium]|nr:TetR/AcrR family transcriptional regulator [Polyangiaceae bacterium]